MLRRGFLKHVAAVAVGSLCPLGIPESRREPGEPLMLESLTINHDGRTVLEFPDGRLERWASWESMLACYGTVSVTEYISFDYVDGSRLAEAFKRAIRDDEIMIEHPGA